MKKNKKTINTIKIAVVLLMAAAIAFSALAPIFGAENDMVDDCGCSVEASITSNQSNLLTRDEVRAEVGLFVQEVQQLTRDFAETPKSVTVVKPVRGLPTGFVFRNELRERVAGDAVRYLQIVLNTDPETRIATSGVGAPGRETNYFGSGTRRSLIRFQQKHKLSATGIVDAATRAKINGVLQSGVTVKEEATERINELRLRLINMAQMMRLLRERIRMIEKQGETEE